jgi:HPt (histidine-containing phosphotransfer) domain-containing protein
VDQPVNFDNLRAITDGDPELEAELFRLFFESSDDCMAGLRAALAADDAMAWRERAHAFKGVCFNLGAESLGALCKQAQEDCRAATDDKQQMLAAMDTGLARVREVLPYKPEGRKSKAGG